MANLLFVGIILGTFASMVGTISKQLMRYSELQKKAGATYRAKIALTMGLVLNVLVGPVVDMGSYAFAPQSIIAPLGGLDVVWNTLSAPCTLGETLTPLLCGGVFVIASGAVGTSFFGSHDEKEFTLEYAQETLIRPTVGFYLIGLASWLGFNIFVLLPRSAAPRGEPWKTGDPLRGLSLGMTAGSIAGNMFCVKAFVELVQQSIEGEDANIWAHWLPYVLLLGAVFFAVSNLYFLTKAMREYEALFMGAVFEGALIVSACISGCVVFRDLEHLEWWQVGLYWLALLCIVGGIFAVAVGVDRNSPVDEVLFEEGVPSEPISPSETSRTLSDTFAEATAPASEATGTRPPTVEISVAIEMAKKGSSVNNMGSPLSDSTETARDRVKSGVSEQSVGERHRAMSGVSMSPSITWSLSKRRTNTVVGTPTGPFRGLPLAMELSMPPTPSSAREKTFTKTPSGTPTSEGGTIANSFGMPSDPEEKDGTSIGKASSNTDEVSAKCGPGAAAGTAHWV